ncbi:hypothetical protein CAPN001_11300 [Capnocytophaga stomatis]|uniref:hypothetical protein n=1 Tax=Capnocytophaga stomatis TaxID=1848904 RepID=UPI00194FD317|nr:hypothetical protein [Capnocytophaga stomatis]GIJ96561.1 hypothetical protein CAPN001_11300 [Capnocytophaga stomatis]
MDRKQYEMYRFFNGENNNPFNAQNQNTQYMFWFYEQHFEEKFQQYESSDWYAFFKEMGIGDEFMALLSEEDYEKPTVTKKRKIFDLWLNKYLFVEKLYPEYGGSENTYKNEYFNPKFDRQLLNQ